MCGIAALFGRIPDRSVIDKMTDLASHRGPDARGVEIFEGAALGHRRLTILDLSQHGNQPMASHDKRYHIVFNGEIYNYIELKKELHNKGYQFVSRSDTEVLLNAFAEWGKDCLDKLNGMFAFVIYDSVKKVFFAARDRFGIKPLYYWVSPSGTLAFASEIKQFTALKDWQPRLNHQMAYDFLNWAVHDHTNETLFAGVNQLRGGEYAYGPVRSTKITVEKWYFLKKNSISDSKIPQTFKDLLTDSIRLRLRADVNLGSCLSGGLDSSSIVCLANDLLKAKNAAEKQQTFSACSKIERFDERRFIDIVASKTGHQSHCIYPDIDVLFNELGSIVWHQDEPFGSTSIFAQWEVFKLAKKHKTKVLLDGQGADEQLAGYTSCYSFHFLSLYRSLRWYKLWQEMRLSKETLGLTHPIKMLGGKILPEMIRRPLKKFYHRPSRKPLWLNFQKLFACDVEPFPDLWKSGLKDYCHTMMESSSLPMLLHYEDRDSMAQSIEARTPFLDYRLVEFTLGLTSDWLIHKGTTKQVLREAMEGAVPGDILARRDKIGFATPEEVWLKHPKFEKLLIQAIELSGGIVNSSVLEEYERVKNGKAPFSNKFWRIISFGRWLHVFNIKVH